MRYNFLPVIAGLLAEFLIPVLTFAAEDQTNCENAYSGDPQLKNLLCVEHDYHDNSNDPELTQSTNSVALTNATSTIQQSTGHETLAPSEQLHN